MEKEYTDKEKIELINKRMKEVEEEKEKLRKKFRKLLSEYKYTIEEGEVFENAFNLLCWEHIFINECRLDSHTLELAKLVRFFKICEIEKNTYKITSTKGQTQKVEISDLELIYDIYQKLEEELYMKIYHKNVYNIDKDSEIRDLCEGIFKYGDLREYFKKRLSIEDIDKFIKFLELQKDFKLTDSMIIGINIKQLLIDIDSLGIIEKKQTKLYSFIYDLLVLRGKRVYKGEGMRGDIGKDKREYVRDCLRALERRDTKISCFEEELEEMLNEDIIARYVFGKGIKN